MTGFGGQTLDILISTIISSTRQVSTPERAWMVSRQHEHYPPSHSQRSCKHQDVCTLSTPASTLICSCQTLSKDHSYTHESLGGCQTRQACNLCTLHRHGRAWRGLFAHSRCFVYSRSKYAHQKDLQQYISAMFMASTVFSLCSTFRSAGR